MIKTFRYSDTNTNGGHHYGNADGIHTETAHPPAAERAVSHKPTHRRDKE